MNDELRTLLASIDDNALIKGATLAKVVRLLAKLAPIPGHGMTASEYPDGIMLHVSDTADAGVSFPFRVRVVDGLVRVDPGFWDFYGQPTFPGWGDGLPFQAAGSPEVISVGSSQRWRFYLRANHDESGNLSGVPVGIQSAVALTNTNTITYLLLASAATEGSFETVNQVAGGSIVTGLGFIVDNSGGLVDIARSHHSY